MCRLIWRKANEWTVISSCSVVLLLIHVGLSKFLFWIRSMMNGRSCSSITVKKGVNFLVGPGYLWHLI